MAIPLSISAADDSIEIWDERPLGHSCASGTDRDLEHFVEAVAE